MSKVDWPTALGGLLPPSFHLPLDTPNRGALLFDSRGCVSCADPNILPLLGLTPGDLSGADTGVAVRGILGRCFKEPEAYISAHDRVEADPHAVFEDVLELAGAERRAIHRYSAPLFDENGGCRGRIEVYSDISKRRELERSARRAYEELKATQEQLVQSEKLRAVGEIASGVAHDFNNTLGIILGNIQLLLRSSEDEATRTRLQAAERAALDGVDTVCRIQEFTRTKSKDQAGPVDLSALAGEVVEMMRPVWQVGAQARGCHIQLATDVADGVIAFCSGPEIREVLINLVLNAVQAMPDGGSIRISTGRSAEHGWLQVADTGVGMTEEVRRRVFDPFFTTRGVEGSGLGMSVAYGIVRRHGGGISIDSEPGRGTVVTVFLPTTNAEPEPAQTGPALEPQSVQQAKILVVDDEAMFAEVLVEMLTECGHEVVAASSGAQAVEMFREEEFDLVFTDLGMPHMSGLQLAQAIKGIRPETPVALLTGWGAAMSDSEAADASIDVTLAKPISFEKLSSVVAEALRSNR